MEEPESPPRPRDGIGPDGKRARWMVRVETTQPAGGSQTCDGRDIKLFPSDPRTGSGGKKDGLTLPMCPQDRFVEPLHGRQEVFEACPYVGVAVPHARVFDERSLLCRSPNGNERQG